MGKGPMIISGQALLGTELALSPVDIIVERGMITAIEDNPLAPPDWICPAFFNAHTHLGDTIAMDCRADGDLAALVTPPDGLKHRLLAAASRQELIAGMRGSITGMIAGGTAGCADFREGGPDGVTALQEARQGLPFRTMIFGREGGENIAGGLGVSSARDVPDIEQIVAGARKAGKKIAFHAGERDAQDVDAALSFSPDLIIHATHATKKQLRCCAEQEIPIAVCPRSNWILGVTSSSRHPPIRLMEEFGCTLYLGTDNVMFVPPDMAGEMAFVSTVYKPEPVNLLRSAIAGSALCGTPFFIQKGARANLFSLAPGKTALYFSRDPIASITKRASFAAIGTNVFNSEAQ